MSRFIELKEQFFGRVFFIFLFAVATACYIQPHQRSQLDFSRCAGTLDLRGSVRIASTYNKSKITKRKAGQVDS